MIRCLIHWRTPKGEKVEYKNTSLSWSLTHLASTVSWTHVNTNQRLMAFHPVTHPFTVRVAAEHFEAAVEALTQQDLIEGRDYLSAYFSCTDETLFWFMAARDAVMIKMLYANAMGW